MFKATVTINRNNNGKLEHIEKEFTDQKEYEKFLAENKVNTGPQNFGGYFTPGYMHPMFGYVPAPTPTYLNQSNCCEDDCGCEVELPIDLDFYEQELAKTEEEKALKAQKKAGYEAALAKLEEYKGKVKGVRDDLLERIEKDMKKVKDELKKLG